MHGREAIGNGEGWARVAARVDAGLVRMRKESEGYDGATTPGYPIGWRLSARSKTLASVSRTAISQNFLLR